MIRSAHAPDERIRMTKKIPDVETSGSLTYETPIFKILVDYPFLVFYLEESSKGEIPT